MKARTNSKISFLILSLIFISHLALGSNSFLSDTHYYWLAGKWEAGCSGDLRVEFTNDWGIIVSNDKGIEFKGKFYIDDNFVYTEDPEIGEGEYSFIVDYNREEDIQDICIEGGDYLEKVYPDNSYKTDNIDWIAGKWFTSDKEFCIEFQSNDAINLYKNGHLINTGSYIFDGKRINSHWKYHNERINSFRYDPTHHSIISTKSSEWLTKQDFLETVDLSWIDGTWIDGSFLEDPVENDANYKQIYIRDGKCTIFHYRNEDPVKGTLSIEKRYDDFLNTEYYSINNDFVIDFKNKSIYHLRDYDIPLYMKKIKD